MQVAARMHSNAFAGFSKQNDQRLHHSRLHTLHKLQTRRTNWLSEPESMTLALSPTVPEHWEVRGTVTRHRSYLRDTAPPGRMLPERISRFAARW